MWVYHPFVLRAVFKEIRAEYWLSSQEITFVIPDEQIEAAAAALDDAGFNRCLDPECLELPEDRDSRSLITAFCSFTMWRVNVWHPVGYAHFPKLRSGIKLGAHRSGSGVEPVISLLRQSEILPWLPSIEMAPT
ncbi:hypothetical protein BDW69DRAFT_182485 [Aspergillus filifer]